jgi:pyruvate dehydrogenase E2 component (dihydrolipoamide acetyltransferase)
MTPVIMPKMGDGMEEGTLLEWLKKEGEAVRPGDVIGTIQTDKATLELEAPGAGKLAGILLQPGQTVPVGAPIAALLADGEPLPADWGSAAPASVQAAPSMPAASAGAEVEPPPVPPAQGRVKASPLARKVAAQSGVDLSLVVGSGPGGRIVEKDVREAVKAGPPSTPRPPSPARDDVKVGLTNLRRITAQRTAESKQSVPHFYVTVDVDVEFLLAVRAKMKEAGEAPSVNDFVMLATAKALVDMPEVNASFGGDHVLMHGSVNLGMAVAVDEGLLVAVVHNAGGMTLRQMAAATKHLGSKAQANKLTPNEMSGSTFSVSNMGMLDVENFAAIINAPNAGILAVGSARSVPVVGPDGSVGVGKRMKVTGSFDHRVVDGVVGARFVNVVRGYLENPTRLFE